MMQPIEALLPLLNEGSKKIFITHHYKPDGDAIGSTLGLYHYLKQKGHDPIVVSPSPIPDNLHWLPGMETVLNFESEPKQCIKKIEEADYIFCLDFNRLSRVKVMGEMLKKAQQPRIMIDHHIDPELDSFAYGISLPEKSSTCEMVYDFILSDNGQAYINQDVMKCIYTGVITDTGSFKYPSVTSSVHRLATDFLERGLKHAVIHNQVFDVSPEKRMRFVGFVLLNRMLIFPKQGLGIVCITKKDMGDYDVSPFDTEGIVNMPLSINTVTCSILLIEVGTEVKVSLRSQGNINVNKIAAQYFNGGGHFNASGGYSQKNTEDTIKKIKEIFNIEGK